MFFYGLNQCCDRWSCVSDDAHVGRVEIIDFSRVEINAYQLASNVQLLDEAVGFRNLRANGYYYVCVWYDPVYLGTHCGATQT